MAKNIKRQCKPSLKVTYRKLAEIIPCGACSTPMWEMVTSEGTCVACRSCNGYKSHRKRESE